MALPGDTLNNGASPYCSDCKLFVKLGVHRSGAGWYIGTWCECGPHSIDSRYYPSEQIARYHFKHNTWERR